MFFFPRNTDLDIYFITLV